jgi:predicted esterase
MGHHPFVRTRRRQATLHLEAGGALLLALGACSAQTPPPAEHGPAPAPPAAAPAATPSACIPGIFCGEGLLELDERTCYVVPEGLATPPAIVFFAHGMLAPDALPPADQGTVRRAAIEQGFVAVLPRGERGLCAWKPEVTENFCWPTRRETVDSAAPAILEAWMDAEAKITSAIGVSFARRYVFGFSNGGYFAAYVGLEGLLAVDGVGVVGAGRTAVDESRSSARRPPFYIAVGDDELDVTQRDADTLASLLSLRQWPIELVIHPGRGHELHEDDFAIAWESWQSLAR